jgi:hypothetical protein
MGCKDTRNYNEMVSYKFAQDWQKAHGVPNPWHRLIAKTPFVLGGAHELSNLSAMDSLIVMRNLGNLARQIHDLPDGSSIEFRIQ